MSYYLIYLEGNPPTMLRKEDCPVFAKKKGECLSCDIFGGLEDEHKGKCLLPKHLTHIKYYGSKRHCPISTGNCPSCSYFLGTGIAGFYCKRRDNENDVHQDDRDGRS